MITALLADNDVQGQVRHVLARCQSAAWAQFWAEVQVPVLDLQDVGLPANSPDAVVWDLCVVARLIELLSEIDDLRGSGRLYLP